MPERSHSVTTPDGRALNVREAGDNDGAAVVVHHGTPGDGTVFAPWAQDAADRGLRLIAYDRPGYGGSSPHPGRVVADAAQDVATILDALGVERFATWGASGGGPHALACAALLEDRCAAAASLAGVGPFDHPELDWLAGMGESNVREFRAARDGRAELEAFCEQERGELVAAQTQELLDAWATILSPADVAALTGELGDFLLGSTRRALEPGVAGWVDDDYAFLAPWGFDVGAIAVPVLVWQGEQDLMVPAGHGRWLARHVPGAEARIWPDDGHLTLLVRRVAELLDWLGQHLD